MSYKQGGLGLFSRFNCYHDGKTKMHNNVVEKEGTFFGFPYAVIMTELGHRCGYVGIPPEHCLYGKNLEELNKIRVHGGVTYGFDNRKGYPVKTKEPMFFIGFDCGHYGDAPDPSVAARIPTISVYLNPGGIDRTREFVENECHEMAKQLANYEEV